MTGRHRATAAEQRIPLTKLRQESLQRIRDWGPSPRHRDRTRPVDLTIDQVARLDIAPVAEQQGWVNVSPALLRRWLELIEFEDTTPMQKVRADVEQLQWELRDALGLPNDDERIA